MAAASSGDLHIKVITRSGFTPPAPFFVKSSSACPASNAAASHEAKCIASTQAYVHGMLTTCIWDAAQKAACMLWEQTEQVQDSSSDPEHLVELAAINSQVQSLSMDLYQNASVAAKVEAWISELGDFAQGPSSLPLRDAIAWEVIARLDESRNIDQAVQQVCPDLCADQTRRSKLLNAVHKNLRQLVCMGEYLTTHAVPSASMLGAAKKRRKGGKKSRQDPDASQDPASQLDNPDGQCERPEGTDTSDAERREDAFERDTQAISDTSDAERIQTQACDAERRDAFERGELDIEDEFHMDSASIADAAHRAPTEVPWTVLSGAPSSINGECGQSAAPSSLLSSTVTASQLGSIVTAFLDAQSAILRKPGMWPVDSHAAPRRRLSFQKSAGHTL